MGNRLEIKVSYLKSVLNNLPDKEYGEKYLVYTKELLKPYINRSGDMQFHTLDFTWDNKKKEWILGLDIANVVEYTRPKPVLNPFKIINAVEDYYGIEKGYLFEKDRHKEIVEARNIAMYFLRNNNNMGLLEIAKLMKLINHTSAIYAVKKVQGFLETGQQPYITNIPALEKILYPNK